ncbi:hypothetical protein LUZ62_065507 [Rhynchospora pubera]|uniref:14-3-3 domain-containing protein n=1 Tax=Rhynchospora pubera TaxID=906938 RepID=A0AAV8EIK4_9POAL|nr:hypothetical protein LUZ62_065507 [Rhynchospora pubera]
MERENEIYRAKLAEVAERFDEMVDSMKKVCMMDGDLSDEERKLLVLAYKKSVESRRDSWRTIQYTEQKMEERDQTEYLQQTKDYRRKVEAEIENICNDCCHLINLYILPLAPDSEVVAFFTKMKGDYYRYLAEVKVGDERQNIANQCRQAYEQASAAASAELESTHVTRLGIALSHSIFYNEIEDNVEKALQLARDAFDQAIDELDNLTEEAAYEDTTYLLELLSNNINMWTPKPANGW